MSDRAHKALPLPPPLFQTLSVHRSHSPWSVWPSNPTPSPPPPPVPKFVCAQIAFSSVSLALKYYAEEMKTGQYQVHHAVIEKAEGSSPNQLNSYFLRDEMSKVLAL